MKKYAFPNYFEINLPSNHHTAALHFCESSQKLIIGDYNGYLWHLDIPHEIELKTIKDDANLHMNKSIHKMKLTLENTPEIGQNFNVTKTTKKYIRCISSDTNSIYTATSSGRIIKSTESIPRKVLKCDKNSLPTNGILCIDVDQKDNLLVAGFDNGAISIWQTDKCNQPVFQFESGSEMQSESISFITTQDKKIITTDLSGHITCRDLRMKGKTLLEKQISENEGITNASLIDGKKKQLFCATSSDMHIVDMKRFEIVTSAGNDFFTTQTLKSAKKKVKISFPGISSSFFSKRDGALFSVTDNFDLYWINLNEERFSIKNKFVSPTIDFKTTDVTCGYLKKIKMGFVVTSSNMHKKLQFVGTSFFDFDNSVAAEEAKFYDDL